MKTILSLILIIIGATLVGGAVWLNTNIADFQESQDQPVADNAPAVTYDSSNSDVDSDDFVQYDTEILVPDTISSQETSSTENNADIAKNDELPLDAQAQNTESSTINIVSSSQNEQTLEEFDSEITEGVVIVTESDEPEVKQETHHPEIPEELEVIDVTTTAVTLPKPQPQAAAKELGKPKLKISILPFDLKGNFYESDKFLGDIISNVLISTSDPDKFEIYERAQLMKIMEERGFQDSQIANYAISAAKFVGVQKVVIGEFTSSGRLCFLAAKLVDCATGQISNPVCVRFKSKDDWPDMIGKLAADLGLSAGSINHEVVIPDRADNDLLNKIGNDTQFGLKLDVVQNKTIFTDGDFISFRVSAKKRCYITLISQDSEGEVSLLLPNPYDHDETTCVNAGETILIPSASAGFEFPIGPPHGVAVIKAIATSRPLELEGVDLEKIMNGQVDLKDGVKAVGVAPARDKWGSDEVSIYTSERNEEISKVQNRPRKHEPQQVEAVKIEEAAPREKDRTAAAPVVDDGRDANDLLRERWNELFGSMVFSSNRFFRSSERSRFSTDSSELLVWYNNSSNFKKVKINKPGTKSPFGVNKEQIFSDPDVRTAVPNIKVSSFGMPSSKLIDLQWALKNRFQPGMDIGWEKYFEKYMHNTPPLIGVVDSSFDPLDSRLTGACWKNEQEIPGNNIDDDKNGYVDDVYGYNFVIDSGKLFDPFTKFSHGSFVSSIIAGKTSNSTNDVAGIVPNGKIITAVALEADSATSTGNLESLISGIRYVVDNGAKVVNLSLGGFVSENDLAAINKLPLWDELQEKNVILVCAAGNENSDNDVDTVFPACLPRDNIVSVMAVDLEGRPGTYWNDESNQWLEFSNYGKKTVDIAAPGTMILGVSAPGKVELADGTSFASAIATGVIALTWGEDPDMDYKQVIDLVKKRAKKNRKISHCCSYPAIINLE